MLTLAPPILGSTTPRIFTPPLIQGAPGPCGCGCALSAETSLGFSLIEFAEEILGIDLLPWQRWLFIHAMELLPNGRFRFRTVLVLVARQNGKTLLIEIKNLWKLFVLEVPLIIGTAQNLDYAEESWEKGLELIESVAELNAEIKHVDRTNGKKQFRLRNGGRWKIAAASRKGGRSLSADDVNLDELREHHVWDSWGAVTKTTMARRNAQVWAPSNAGDDRSVVLNDLREKAIEAIENPAHANTSLGIFEWSPPDDCAIDDPQMWRLANPAMGYPQGISIEALQAACATDPEPVFRTECLCQRVPDLVPSKIPLTAWVKCAEPNSQIVGPVVLSWEVSWDRLHGAIGLAGYTSAGNPQIEVIDYREGTDWIAGRMGEVCKRQKVTAVVFNPAGPGASLLTEVTERLPVRFEPQPMTARDQANACGRIYDAAMPVPGAERGVLRHLGDVRLLDALRRSSTRTLVDAWAWDMRNSIGEISPLAVVTNALHGLFVWGKPPAPALSPVVDLIPGVRSELDFMDIGF
jgi:hypothetical protein